MNVRQRYFTFTDVQEGEQNQLFVRFDVHLVRDIGRERKDELELLNGVLVSFKASHHEAFVVEVAHDVHGSRAFSETCCREIDDLQRMLVAFGLKAQLGELSMQRSAHRVIIKPVRPTALNLFKST